MKRRTYMTLELYDAIKSDLDSGVLTRREIADKHDTDPSQVSRIASGVLKRPVSGRASRKKPGESFSLTVADIEIGEDGDDRVLDLKLGMQLGYSRPDNIRNLIRRHERELEKYGTVVQTPLRRKAADATDATGDDPEYRLNEPQSLIVIMKSGAPLAELGRRHIIQVFLEAKKMHRMPAASIDRAWLMDRLDQQDKRFDQICRGIIWLEKKFPESLINNPKFKKVMFGGNARTLMKRMRDAGMVPPAVGDLFPPDIPQDPWEEQNLHEIDDDYQDDSQSDSQQCCEPSPDPGPAAKGPKPREIYRLPAQVVDSHDMNFTSARQMALREDWDADWRSGGNIRSLMACAYRAYKAIGGKISYYCETDGQARLPTPFFNKFMEDEGNAMVADMIARYKAAHPDAKPEAPEGTVPFRKPEKAKDRNDPDKPL